MDDEDFPTVGLTDFDVWMTKLFFHMVKVGFLSYNQLGTLDREHFKQYYDDGYTVQEAFDEDITYFGD